MKNGGAEPTRILAALPADGRLPLLDRSDAIALSHLVLFASALVDWNEPAQAIEEFISETEGGRWYAPIATADLLRSYYLRRWFELNPVELEFLFQQGEAHETPPIETEQTRRFDHFFEHYQLKDIVQPLIEHQLGTRSRGPSACSCEAEL